VLLLRRKPGPRHRLPQQEIALRKSSTPEFKPEGYYDAILKQHDPKVEIADEKSEPRQFIHQEDSPGVDRYLKEDERIVLNILRMKHNSCSQATLRVVTDFSKAKLSRILAEMEARGIIYKEQQGRKNMITLKG
jgi:DNA phosphorothioation-dependent restriction protein DptG